jgi:hypothetical protein
MTTFFSRACARARVCALFFFDASRYKICAFFFMLEIQNTKLNKTIKRDTKKNELKMKQSRHFFSVRVSFARLDAFHNRNKNNEAISAFFFCCCLRGGTCVRVLEIETIQNEKKNKGALAIFDFRARWSMSVWN